MTASGRVNAGRLRQVMAEWRRQPEVDEGQQVHALIEPLLAKGWLPDGHESVDAILMGEQYHLGGEEDTRWMADLAGITPEDRVLDVACYIGGPARQLARDYGCTVLGVDISHVHVAVAGKLSYLTGLEHSAAFLCASADAVPLPGGSVTVAWSQCSLPGDLSWLREMDRVLKPDGRLAFTCLIRRGACDDGSLLPLAEIQHRVAEMGYRVVKAEDISELDLEHGWLPARAKLAEDEAHYRDLMGDEWVRTARRSIDQDIAEWRAARMGNGRVVAVKE